MGYSANQSVSLRLRNFLSIQGRTSGDCEWRTVGEITARHRSYVWCYIESRGGEARGVGPGGVPRLSSDASHPA